MPAPNPTLRQRQLAMRLRELRHERGLSIAEVAEHLLCSPTKISRIETGQRRASLRDVRDLCKLYDVDQSHTTELMTLAKDARQKEWWQAYDNVIFQPMLGLEAGATSITEYEITTVPGPLQTEDYARAVIRGWLPGIEPTILEERVKSREKRKKDVLYRSDPPRYWVLLDESVLHRHVGGRQTMHRQLDHLLEISDLPQVTVQVIPYTAGAHMGFDSPFRMLAFDRNSGITDTVFIEHQMGLFYLEDDKTLQRFREIIDRLRAEALGTQQSKRHIAEIAAKFA
ncbi:helix-turn-helix domain-containing protein [Actinomadura sp. ATCC 31491]|uniref:Helix-turn-helix domain-containing protein n=1 Tax=Actinomadura luzonensis TaxID=2805427 RepID=A0ABT0GCD7_9ACTN|nr:helix-turn-helix transcriptional regulator [Actinomadura luzonensis]MCK2221761.1 helix-turn-helix domain-containing protein [Actinomadura luzonensis]